MPLPYRDEQPFLFPKKVKAEGGILSIKETYQNEGKDYHAFILIAT